MVSTVAALDSGIIVDSAKGTCGGVDGDGGVDCEDTVDGDRDRDRDVSLTVSAALGSCRSLTTSICSSVNTKKICLVHGRLTITE